MKKTKQGKTIKRRKVQFSFKTEAARQVFLLGDFNQWNPTTHPMRNTGDGNWARVIMVPPGTYEYKFLIDGKWQEDPQNEQTCPNCFGTLNSVIRVN